jgi:hypothetical protein
MKKIAALTALLALITSCAGPATTGRQAPPSTSGGSTDARRPTTTARVDPAQAARLQQVMLPLLQVMDHPVPLGQVKVGIVADPRINAANAGGGQFFVTTGLLNKADDDKLRM